MRQLASNNLCHADNYELPLARQPERRGVASDMIHAQKTAAAAVCMAIQMSGLEDKEIYLTLHIDAAQFSRIKKGESNFPADKIKAFCDVVGNMVYPEWIAYQVGCTLTMIRSEAERRAYEAEQRTAALEAENAMLKGLLVGKAA